MTGRRRRRRWAAEQKRRIVEETRAPGASVSVVARRHDLNANLLFKWKRDVLGRIADHPIKRIDELLPWNWAAARSIAAAA